jgi:hypothetical protein
MALSKVKRLMSLEQDGEYIGEEGAQIIEAMNYRTVRVCVSQVI